MDSRRCRIFIRIGVKFVAVFNKHMINITNTQYLNYLVDFVTV